MTFVRINDHWYKYDKAHNRAINYNGGHFYLSADDEAGAEYIETEDWRTLYLETGYNPLLFTSRFIHSGWVDPDGTLYPAEAHLCTADDICEIIYGDADTHNSEDYLYKRGWVKVTDSLMWEHYIQDPNMFSNITVAQFRIIDEFCDDHRLLKPWVFMSSELFEEDV